jgi:hypothetical protein
MMHRFGGYHLGCASGSWSDLSRAIVHDHFLSVCPGSCRDRMLYSTVCCYHFYHRLCLAVVEDHIDSAAFVFAIHLVSQFLHGPTTHFEHQKVGKNMCEVPIQMLFVGVGASMFTFVKKCVERYVS